MSTRRGNTQGARAEMVIDGRTLGRVLGSPGEEALAELASLCGGVVVCRASPAQKAAIVRMMARHKQQRLHVRPRPRVGFSKFGHRRHVHGGAAQATAPACAAHPVSRFSRFNELAQQLWT